MSASRKTAREEAARAIVEASKCPDCGGTGTDYGTNGREPDRCVTCKGSGTRVPAKEKPMSGGSVKVYTEAVCSICDTVRRTEGAEGDTPPIGWADLKLAIRLTGSGWTNREVMSWFLCEKCRILVTSYINEMQRTRAGEGRKK